MMSEQRTGATDPQACIVDTNVIVSGLIGSDSSSPPCRILDAMLDGRVLYLMSSDLLKEYSSVLRRPALRRLHGLTDNEIDEFLAELVANAPWREPASASSAPDPGDSHLWSLLASQERACLVTGDRLLLENAPEGTSAVSPRHFVDTMLQPANR